MSINWMTVNVFLVLPESLADLMCHRNCCPHEGRGQVLKFLVGKKSIFAFEDTIYSSTEEMPIR
jgi:hypothetical protein